ncbi:MAG: hypothetical protein ABFD04_15530 [Syntrophomonas sp.]
MPNYNHFLKMTDEQGMLQFSRLAAPDEASGYTLDDNARALIIALHMDNSPLAERLARNLDQARRPDGSWSNLLLNGRYYNNFDSEDSIGRGLVACSLGAQSPWLRVSGPCSRMFSQYIKHLDHFTSPRAIAYGILALTRAKPGKDGLALLQKLCDKLVSLYQIHQGVHWHWFEDYMTYCNGILPQALMAAYQVSGDKRTLKVAHDSLKHLVEVLFCQGYLNIIGNQGWYQKGGRIPLYDQQPVDAASTAFACNEAYQVLGLNDYRDLARLACLWYKGLNVKGLSLIDPISGGCYDALTEDGVNMNQGAEAVLSFLASRVVMEKLSISEEFEESLSY